jgi:hypothetical protein
MCVSSVAEQVLVLFEYGAPQLKKTSYRALCLVSHSVDVVYMSVHSLAFSVQS